MLGCGHMAIASQICILNIESFTFIIRFLNIIVQSYPECGWKSNVVVNIYSYYHLLTK